MKGLHLEALLQELKQKVRALWGEVAAQAARQHIEADFRQEGWKTGDPFPKDGRDYVRMGFWC
ncbi:MAG: hypothetical protein HKM06_07515 [Spirochaetales bacterium]|nr:hypothetical protein [Spirochaetales bacterium]